MPVPSTALPESPYHVEAVNLASVQSAGVLEAVPSAVFHLVHGRNNWEIGDVDGTAYWLPELVEVQVVPGVNQCRTVRQGEPPENAYLGQLAWLASRKQIAIPMDAKVGTTTSYLARTDCIHPRTKRAGVRHFDAWSRPKPTEEGQGVKFWRDTQAYNRWRLELVQHGWVRPDGTTGRLPDANPDVIAKKVDRAKFHLSRKEAESGLPDRAYKEEVDKRLAQVEQVTGAQVPRYEGSTAVGVVDYSTALIAALAARLRAGESAAVVFADAPGVDDRIRSAALAAAGTAAAPAPTEPGPRDDAEPEPRTAPSKRGAR
jgi:hypothetical protein